MTIREVLDLIQMIFDTLKKYLQIIFSGEDENAQK